MRPDEPAAPCVPWIHSTFGKRIEMCRAQLYIKGFLSEKENERIKQRIANWQNRRRPAEAHTSSQEQS
jgi:hypothetical protein